MGYDAANGANLLLGKGAIYFDRHDSDGNSTGERFLGNVTKFEISTADETKEKYSSVDATAGLVKKLVTKRTPTLALSMDEFTPENIALVLMGSISALAQTSGTLSAHSIAGVLQGCWYSVGKRHISAVVVTSNAQSPVTYVIHDDYEVDAVSGRVYVVPGGDIADASTIKVSCSYAADASKTIAGGDSNLIEGSVRFKGDPKSGPAIEVLVWKCTVTTDGVVSLISDDYAEAPLKLEVMPDTVNHPNEPYYQMIMLDTWTAPA